MAKKTGPKGPREWASVQADEDGSLTLTPKQSVSSRTRERAQDAIDLARRMLNDAEGWNRRATGLPEYLYDALERFYREITEGRADASIIVRAVEQALSEDLKTAAAFERVAREQLSSPGTVRRIYYAHRRGEFK